MLESLSNVIKTKSIRRGILLAALATIIPAITLRAEEKREQRMKGKILDGINIPHLEVHPPRMENKKLPDGQVFLGAPDNSLPFLTLEITFPGGSSSESENRTGSLKALTSLMQIGGTANMNGDQLAEELARKGIKLSIKANYETWSIQVTSLKSDFDQAFNILSDVLLNPALPSDRLEVIKDSFRTDIKQRNDNPRSISPRKIAEIMFRGFSPSRTIQQEDIERLNIETLEDEHKKRLSPEGVIVSVSGDYDTDDIISRVSSLLKKFPTDNPEPEENLTFETLKKNIPDCADKIVLVDTPAQQAAISIGGALPPHNHEDFFALQTGNYILGGGSFNSRLMREIRAKRGLAYSTYSVNYFNKSYGRFAAASGTRVDQTTLALSLMLSMIEDMKNGVTEEELALAKDAILNSHVFQFEDPQSYVAGEVRFRRHGMPDNYLEIFPKKIDSITSDDIARVYSKYVKPSNLCIVVTGPADQLKDSLETIRPVRVIAPEELISL